jgi:hypothetical protein
MLCYGMRYALLLFALVCVAPAAARADAPAGFVGPPGFRLPLTLGVSGSPTSTRPGTTSPSSVALSRSNATARQGTFARPWMHEVRRIEHEGPPNILSGMRRPADVLTGQPMDVLSGH